MLRKKQRRLEAESNQVNLNIFTTPMLDLAFQLLAFALMFFRPGIVVEGFVDGKLLPPKQVAAQSKDAKKKDVEPEKRTDIKPDDVTDTITIPIKAVAPGQVEGDREEGELSQIEFLTKEDQGKPQLIADRVDEVKTAMQKLRAWMKKKYADRKRKKLDPKETVIELQPDYNLKYRYVVEIWSVCRSAGFESVGLIAPKEKEAADTTK